MSAGLNLSADWFNIQLLEQNYDTMKAQAGN